MDGIALAAGALIGSEALGFTNFSGIANSTNNSGQSENNNGISAFAGEIGKQMSGVQNSLSEMQNSIVKTQQNVNNFKSNAVTNAQLVSAISNIETGPTMAEVSQFVNSQNEESGIDTSEIMRIIETMNGNGNQDDSSDSRNPDNGGSGNTTVQNFEQKVLELQFENEKGDTTDLQDFREPGDGVQVGDAVAIAGEIGHQSGQVVNDAIGIGTKTGNTWAQTYKAVMGEEYSTENTFAEGTGPSEKRLYEGPLWKGPDPFNLGGNNQKDERDTKTNTDTNRNTESTSETQNDNEDRNTVGNTLSGFAVR